MCPQTNESYSNSDVFQWIGNALKNENLSKYEVQITGMTKKGDNYMGEIIFVDVNGLNLTGEQKQYNLVLKIGKKDPQLREMFQARLVYEREIFVYNNIVPAFKQLQEERHLEQINLLPKCYGTILDHENEVLMLQNLRKTGYDLHNRQTNLDMEHLKITLSAYAKWHALSFAYRDQKRESFDAAFSHIENIFKTFIKLEHFQLLLNTGQENVYEVLQKNDPALFERFQMQMKGGFIEKFKGFISVDDPQTVLIHGDCWNNNMMFKYQESDVKHLHPTDVTLLDFQATNLAPPVFDLSYHIYAVCSGTELSRLKELLQIYYSCFSGYLKKLGSDSDKLFPYTDLVKQWRKYSAYGLILGTMTFPFTLSDTEDTIDFKDLNEIVIKNIITKVHQKNNNMTERILDVVRNFIEFNEF